MRGKVADSKRCTARSKQTGKRCGYPAVPGKDKCRFHGGLTPIKHGLYSKYAGRSFVDLVRAWRESPELIDLRQLIAEQHVLKASVLARLEKPDGTIEISDRDREALTVLHEAIGRNIVRLSRLEEELKVDVSVVEALVVQIQDVLRLELANDPACLQRIADRLGQLSAREIGTGVNRKPILFRPSMRRTV